MSFLSLSPELIEQIASYLRPKDLAALMLSCRQFRDVVEGSLLLQYICRTGLAGVYDPLCDLSTQSIADRMEILRRWEASWADLERSLIAPRLVISIDRDPQGESFLCNDYLFYVDPHSGWEDQRPSALSYVDLRDALRTGQYTWKRLYHEEGLMLYTQAFSIEENDLVVSAFSFHTTPGLLPRIMLQFTSVQTGGPHPLARLPNMQVDTPWFGLSTYRQLEIIGDRIVLVLASRGTEGAQRVHIYLGDWKQGRMTLVHGSPFGSYTGAFAVLSSDLLLFLNYDAPSIEICHLIDPGPIPRNGSSSSDNGSPPLTPTPTPSLRVVRTLALPGWRITSALMDTDPYIKREHEPVESFQGQEWEQGCVRLMRAPAALPFHSTPEDMLIGVRIYIVDSASIYKSVMMTISHSALCKLAAEGSLPDSCQQDPDSSAGCGAGGEGEGKGSVEQKQERVMVPWEEWRSKAASIAPPTFHYSITKHVGQRLFLLDPERLVIRDFSARRVRRACARSHRTHVCTNTCGDNDKQKGGASAPATEADIQGGSGSCFKDDVVSSLPFFETHVDLRTRPGVVNFLTDGERLVVFVRQGLDGEPMTFDVHVLGDNTSL